MRKHIILGIGLAVLIFGIVLTIVRYDAWFGNPVEPIYTIKEKSNLVLTYSEDTTLALTWRDGETAKEEDFTNGENIDTIIKTEGGSAKYYQRRIPGRAPSAHKLLVLGDIQDQDEEQAYITRHALRKVVNLQHPDVIVQLGDLIERPMQCAWDRFSIAFDSIDTIIPVIAIEGNHDYLKGLNRHADIRPSLVFPYLRQTNIAACAKLSICPDTLELFILDSNNNIPNLFRQAKWLDKSLEKSDALYKVVLCHHPMRSTEFPLNNLFVRLAFERIVRKHNVQLVLSGHEHTFSHTKNPYHQIVTHFSAKNYEGVHGRHYTILEIINNELSVKVFNESNSTVETFSIKSQK